MAAQVSANGLEERIRQVMAGVLEVDAGAIGEGFGRDDAPAWDSLNHLRLVTALEEAFGIRLTMREVSEMERFEAVRRIVAAHLQGGA